MASSDQGNGRQSRPFWNLPPLVTTFAQAPAGMNQHGNLRDGYLCDWCEPGAQAELTDMKTFVAHGMDNHQLLGIELTQSVAHGSNYLGEDLAARGMGQSFGLGGYVNNYGHNPPVAQRTAVPSRQTATRAPGKNNAATRLANRQAKNQAGHGRDIEYSLALPARHANSVDSRPATDSEVRSGSFDGEVRTLRPALKLGDPRARSKCDDNTSRTAAFWAGSSKKPFSNLDEFAKVPFAPSQIHTYHFKDHDQTSGETSESSQTATPTRSGPSPHQAPYANNSQPTRSQTRGPIAFMEADQMTPDHPNQFQQSITARHDDQVAGLTPGGHQIGDMLGSSHTPPPAELGAIFQFPIYAIDSQPIQLEKTDPSVFMGFNSVAPDSPRTFQKRTTRTYEESVANEASIDPHAQDMPGGSPSHPRSDNCTRVFDVPGTWNELDGSGLETVTMNNAGLAGLSGLAQFDAITQNADTQRSDHAAYDERYFLGD